MDVFNKFKRYKNTHLKLQAKQIKNSSELLEQ